MDDWAAASSLLHPHLMRLFHTGRCQFEQHQMLYAVTEYAEETLAMVLPERPLTPAETGEMLMPVVDALSYVHSKDLVYGRLKPANIMVVADQMKLPIDGIHRLGSLWKPDVSSAIYDAPETAAGGISPAADVWSLGVTLIETLTQCQPVWERSSKTDPVVPDSVPQPFADIARRCLRLEPARRCTLSEIQMLLNPNRPAAVPASRSDKTVQSKVAAPRNELAEAASKMSNRRRVPVLIATAVIVIVVAALLLMRSHKSEPPSTAPQAPSTAATVVPAPASSQPPPSVPQTGQAAGAAGKGEVAQRVMPDVSDRATKTIHGKFAVKIRVTADENGKVSDAAFESHGPSRYFANQALQAARNWTFKPPQVSGHPVASRWVLRFEFQRSGIDVIPVEVSP